MTIPEVLQEREPYTGRFPMNALKAPYLLENNRAMHATLTELNLAHEYWDIPGIKHDLRRLSAWLGTDGLQFAVRHFGGGLKRVQTVAVCGSRTG